MIVAALLPLIVAGPAHSEADGVTYVDSSIEFEGQLLNHRFVDLDGDGRMSLCVALRNPQGRRELRIYEANRRGFDPGVFREVPVHPDVLAFGFADVRDEPGQELLLLTRSGAHSFSLTKEGYAGNISRLATEPLLYDVPDSRALPYWSYVLSVGVRDHVLLPGRAGVTIWGPREGEEGSDHYSLHTRVGSEGEVQIDRSTSGRGDGVATSGSGKIRLGVFGNSDGVFLSSDPSVTLLRDGKSYPAPALVDLQGDGRLDLVYLEDDRLHVYLCGPEGIRGEPSWVEELPDYLQPEDATVRFEFVDVDADGDLDLMARVSEEMSGLGDREVRLFVLRNDGGRLMPAEATQVLRFEAAMLIQSVVDADADGTPDLIIRKFSLPSMVEAVSGLEFEMNYMAFLGTGERRPFERKPAFKQSEVFGVDNIDQVIKRRRLDVDCSGDGVPDLVELDLQGRIVIRRLVRESSFFGGDSWEYETAPWKRFERRGTILSLDLRDLNGDGVGDIVTPMRDSLTVLMSSRRR